MKSLLYYSAVALLTLTSCNKETQKPAPNKIVVPFTEVGRQMKSEVPNSTPATSSAVATTSADANPAHGQPGHRCDIPVGASLSTPAAPTPAATQNSAPQNTATQPATIPAPVVTEAGMNPPHGQENHRCDIAVGAPLPKV